MYLVSIEYEINIYPFPMLAYFIPPGENYHLG